MQENVDFLEKALLEPSQIDLQKTPAFDHTWCVEAGRQRISTLPGPLLGFGRHRSAALDLYYFHFGNSPLPQTGLGRQRFPVRKNFPLQSPLELQKR